MNLVAFGRAKQGTDDASLREFEIGRRRPFLGTFFGKDVARYRVTLFHRNSCDISSHRDEARRRTRRRRRRDSPVGFSTSRFFFFFFFRHRRRRLLLPSLLHQLIRLARENALRSFAGFNSRQVKGGGERERARCKSRDTRGVAADRKQTALNISFIGKPESGLALSIPF